MVSQNPLSPEETLETKGNESNSTREAKKENPEFHLDLNNMRALSRKKGRTLAPLNRHKLDASKEFSMDSSHHRPQNLSLRNSLDYSLDRQSHFPKGFNSDRNSLVSKVNFEFYFTFAKISTR